MQKINQPPLQIQQHRTVKTLIEINGTWEHPAHIKADILPVKSQSAM